MYRKKDENKAFVELYKEMFTAKNNNALHTKIFHTKERKKKRKKVNEDNAV